MYILYSIILCCICFGYYVTSIMMEKRVLVIWPPTCCILLCGSGALKTLRQRRGGDQTQGARVVFRLSGGGGMARRLCYI